MAAPTSAEQTTSTPTGEPMSANAEDLQDFVVDFLEKQVGSDLKSLKNVGDLLEKLREETSLLEEQVKRQLAKLVVFVQKCEVPVWGDLHRRQGTP